MPKSTPIVTFCQFTNTMPLNFAGSAGYATYARVLYDASSAGSTSQSPSIPTSEPATGAYDTAVPSRKYSSITYPRSRRPSIGDPKIHPLPPSTGPETTGSRVTLI